ncbi:MAG: hypothetical protein ACLQUT_13160 [Thermoleophilia bacterium]
MSILWPSIVVALAAATLTTLALVRLLSGARGSRDVHGTVWQFAGLLLGFALCALVELLDGPRRYLILALPALAGCCWLLGLLAAEYTRPRTQTGTIRVAGLAPRTPGHYVARWARAAMRAAFLIAAALALAASAMGSPSRSARLSATTSTRTLLGHGPWPGWYYGAPALIGLLCGLALTEVTVSLIAARAPLTTDATVDARARVQAARAALTAATLIALPVLGALLLEMGAGLAGVAPSALARDLAHAMVLAGAMTLLASAAAWLAALVSGGRAVVPRVAEP